ncbi:expansin EXLX1 family cellulose-binding protein [Frankia sp. Cppng1_Ct_nod]|uniref:expansin EXLX1 family cellulose-binding protein n=1 Tax=Frankia sp. Cppng1_Ct_nod TaxID=2897162 RepID=UPI002025A099|nr:expansin EXLX1 family cellulose-binding protein [Frankia sp. Cppng1_Ct_nod]
MGSFLHGRLYRYPVTVLIGAGVVLSIIGGCQLTGLTNQSSPSPVTPATTAAVPATTQPVAPGIQPGPPPSPTASATTATAPVSVTTPAHTQAAKPNATTRPATQSTAQGTAPKDNGRIRPGVTYTGQGTFYSLGGGLGNCLYEGAGLEASHAYAALNDADFENARMCGAYIQATGPRGTIVVKIVDRCPECKPGDVDFSQEAFAAIADPVAGRVAISWNLVSPGDIGNVQYRIKDGSSAYWLAVQPRNHRNPVVSLEISVNGTWLALPREDYNYFLAPNGLGAGPFTVRLTDIYGQQLVNSGIMLSPTVIQSTSSQFARH